MSYKRFTLAAVIVALAGLAYTAERPASDGKDNSHEMGPMGMHGEDHNAPLHRQIMSVFILPEMQSELGLSNEQTAELRRLKQDLLTKAKATATETAERHKELDALLSGDTSRTRAVKGLFEKIADLRAQLQFAGFETATKMKALLNDAQKSKFAAMKPEELHRLMMSRANMGEMEQAMQLMAAEGMGMRQGMMQNGMGMGMQNGMGMQGGMGMGQGMASGPGMGSHGDSGHDAAPHDATPSDPHESHHDSH